MHRLDGHWVAKRVGILEHYKSMTISEIVLFDAYLLLANKQTWECWRTVRQLEEMLPMKRRTIINAKRSLVERGWITKINQTGVFIPKLYRYSEDMVQDGQQMVQKGQHSSSSENGRMVHLGQQKVQNGQQPVQNGQQKVPFGTTIIEDESIIEDDTLLLRSGKSEISGLCKPDLPLQSEISGADPPERPYLHTLKSIPDYPFSFEKDLSFIRDLLVDFPALDLEKEIKDWKTWLLDRKLKGKINYRSRLRRWLTNSMKYMEGKRHGKQGHHGGQPETHGEKRCLPVPGGHTGRKGFDLPSDFPIDAGARLDEENRGAAGGHGAIKTH
jgi:hypothetical protein